MISVLFARRDCRSCPDRLACTGNTDGRGRHLTLMPQPLQDIQTSMRAEQQTPECEPHRLPSTNAVLLHARHVALTRRQIESYEWKPTRFRASAKRP